ncbi:hypothetical protein N8I74_10125 [Chitiniphilus purpureus]|uniref:Beta-ketoacyl synthase N-terminal domain-containing protein n=1 Tax=Chitiniphilus purpureus TaxID=2981137 RepID=A0ABY6DH56_9NEIS|nr:hypothetical protein [Chitiniphilus sp. CD1]UXY13680.1 hypothetical protein N8I74_10125 [Chitiniphilus sp. CD1]
MSGFWKSLLQDTSTAAEATVAFKPLRIAGRGICCPVGHTAAAATAAINARMNHFRETAFLAEGHEPIVGAALHGVEIWGAARWRNMLERVLAECLAPRQPLAAGQTPLIVVLAPEAGRPGAGAHWLPQALDEAQAALGLRCHPESTVLALGKAGLVAALRRVSEHLHQVRSAGAFGIVVAVDSFLSAPVINHYLAAERIKTADNSDGFIPGEGAAAIMLTRDADPQGRGVWIEGVGEALEEAHWGSDQPNRAKALVQAIRQAAASAGCKVADQTFQISGMSGESPYFKEASLAIGRALEHRVEQFPHELLARSVGEIGAANGVLTLAWLADAMTRRSGPGERGLLHLANDDGLRSALIVRYREAS